MDNGIFILDAAEDIRDQAHRLSELVDQGSGYSMSRSQLRIYDRALTIASLCEEIITEVVYGD